MANTLRQNALAKYKKDKLTSWIVGLFTSIFIAAIIFLGVAVSGLSIITIPLVVLPFFFAMIMNHIGLRYDSQITLKNHLHFFFSYFRYPFNGCFRVFISIIKSIIVYAASFLLISIGLNIYTLISGSGSVETTSNMILNLLYSAETTEEEIMNLFVLDGSFTSIYLLLIYFIPFSLAVFYFIYRIFYESLSIYIRVSVTKAHPTFLRSIIAECFRNNRKTLKKDFWSLNFPLAILMLFGFIISSINCYLFISNNILFILPFAFACSFLLSMFFMPFFFFNLDVIYEKYELNFKNNSITAINNILHRIQMNIDLTQEERKEVESTLSEMIDEDKEKDP